MEGIMTPEMNDKLRRSIREMLNDDDYLGGPLQRPYPRAIQEGLIDAILCEVEEIVLEALAVGPTEG